MRLGRPKQLLPWNGTTLLGTAIQQLAVSGIKRLVIVLGAHESQIRRHCVVPSGVRLEVVTNLRWSEGQSTSLRAGVNHMLAIKERGATLVALCDQPLIGAHHYQELLTKLIGHGCYASATEYPEGLGVPACFSAAALQSLAIAIGDSGAKKWLRAETIRTIERVPCPAAAMDIDTERDYHERLNHGQTF